MDAKSGGQRHQAKVVVQAAPRAPFEVIETEFVPQAPDLPADRISGLPGRLP